PKHESPPRIGAVVYQDMTHRFKRHDDKSCTKITQLRHRVPVKTALQARPRVAQARSPGLIAARKRPFKIDLQRLRASSHKAVTYPAAEATPISHQMQGLQHAGLSCAVISREKVQPGSGLKLHVGQPSHVTDPQPGHPHGAPSRSGVQGAKRPDEAGRFCFTWNTASVTASTASPRGGISRSRLRAPAPTSWRRAAA